MTSQPLVDATFLADWLGVSRAYVYEHAEELGAIRLPQSTTPRRERKSEPKPRLRFDLEEVRRRLTSCDAGSESNAPEPAQPPVSRRRWRGGSGTKVDLLPIRGGFPRSETS